jgi:hypothetical protein
VLRTIGPIITIVVLVSVGVVGACTNPEIENRQWNEIQTLSASITELKAYASDLESRVDSLHTIVLRQDTALRLIVDFTGAQVPGYRPPN